MTLKQETRDGIKAELLRRMEKLPSTLGLDAYGITAETMGITSDFLDRVIDEAYLAVFTADELDEMHVFYQRFAERSLTLEKLVEGAVANTIEANKDAVLAKLGGE